MRVIVKARKYRYKHYKKLISQFINFRWKEEEIIANNHRFIFCTS